MSAATTTSAGSPIRSPSRSQQPPAGLHLVVLQQRVADLEAAGLEEREAHPAADQQPVDLRQQRGDHPELVGDLAAAEDHHVRPAQLARRGRSAGTAPAARRAAGRPRTPGAAGHVVDAGVLAVHGAERVVHVGPDEPTSAASRSANAPRSASSLLVSPGSKRTFSSTATPPSTSPSTVAAAPSPTVSVPNATVPAEQLAEPRGDRAQRVLRVRRALGPAEVGGHDHPGAGVGQPGDRGHRGPDPAVVGDPGAVQRHVEVGADQHPPARHPLGEQVVERLHRGRRLSSSREPTSVTRSARRLE